MRPIFMMTRQRPRNMGCLGCLSWLTIFTLMGLGLALTIIR